jgi:hypothetical protein
VSNETSKIITQMEGRLRPVLDLGRLREPRQYDSELLTFSDVPRTPNTSYLSTNKSTCIYKATFPINYSFTISP